MKSMGETVSFPYVIRHKKFTLEITISNITDLYLHEEIVREVEEGLRRLRVVCGGNVFEGRRYEEDIYVFEG